MDDKTKFQILKTSLRKMSKEEVFQSLIGLVDCHLPKKQIDDTIANYTRRGVPFPDSNAYRALANYTVSYFKALLELSREYEKEAIKLEKQINQKPKSN